MKKNLLITILVLAFLYACNNSSENKSASTEDSLNTETQIAEESHSNTTSSDNSSSNNSTSDTSPSNTADFNINSIPVTKNINGEYPYFKLPNGYAYNNPNTYHGTGAIKDYDKEYFYNHGSYIPVEGKSYKAAIRTIDNKQYSKLELQKSFDDFINKVGGVKINNGEELNEGEKERLNKLDRNAYSNGYLHSSNNFSDVHTYIIRTSDKQVWVQYNLGYENAALTVLETEDFVNTMSIIPAAQIKQQLDKDGKAIVYINFDTDKATLQPDGKDAVKEIAKLMKETNDLKLSIEGHTDDSGDVAYNKQLSQRRAETVAYELTVAAIAATRLETKGFGSEKPLVANDSETNKAKNRRVELVKI
ncbi:MAG: OmpA family protein [Bacteroidota bacterium]|nr:OmpA family protein [Bacteroidota bacterium]